MTDLPAFITTFERDGTNYSLKLSKMQPGDTITLKVKRDPATWTEHDSEYEDQPNVLGIFETEIDGEVRDITAFLSQTRQRGEGTRDTLLIDNLRKLSVGDAVTLGLDEREIGSGKYKGKTFKLFTLTPVEETVFQ